MRPACLYQSDDVKNAFAVAMGWGATSFAGKSSNDLLKGYLDIISNVDCNKSYENNDDVLPQGIISSQICAGDPKKERDTW